MITHAKKLAIDAALYKEQRDELAEALCAILDTLDPNCRWDHNGHCQSHNLDHQLDGCRVERARAILAKVRHD